MNRRALGILGDVLLLGALACYVLPGALEQRKMSESEEGAGGPPRGPCAPCMAARLARAEREKAEREAAAEQERDADELRDMQQQRDAAEFQAGWSAGHVPSGRPFLIDEAGQQPDEAPTE